MPICPRCHQTSPNAGDVCEEHGLFYVDEASLEVAPDDDLLGRYIGDRFAVMAILGDGGMGKVYRSVQYPVGREVALKVLKASLQENDRFLARFHREAQVIARLNHPNIVTMYDFGTDPDGTEYIAMEFVDGDPLSVYLRRNVDPAFVLHVAAQTAAALQEAHECGVVHRDLKPDNIMITSVGDDDVYVKVLDFGLAHLATGEEHLALTAAGEVFGTPLYMSPEQATGEDLGPPADLYSLGCIVYELITGRPPFRGTRPMNVLMKHVNAPVPPIEPKPGLNISGEFCQVVMNCLTKYPHDRYQAARDLLDDLYATPEGSNLAASVPSISRSVDLRSLKTQAAARSDDSVRPGDAVPPDSSKPAGRPHAANDPADVDSEVTTIPKAGKALDRAPSAAGLPIAEGSKPDSDGRPNLVILAAVAAVLIGVGAAVWMSSGDSSPDEKTVEEETAKVDDPITHTIEDPDPELGAAHVAGARTAVAIAVDASLEQSRLAYTFDDMRLALDNPSGRKPRKVKVKKPKIKNRSWSDQIAIFHRKEVKTTTYIDPVVLVFGD